MKLYYGCERCGRVIVPQYRDYCCGNCGNPPPHPEMRVPDADYKMRQCEVCKEIVGLPDLADLRTEECPRCRRIDSLVAIR